MSVDRDLKRNVRGQIVSYEIPQPAQVPVGTHFRHTLKCILHHKMVEQQLPKGLD